MGSFKRKTFVEISAGFQLQGGSGVFQELSNTIFSRKRGYFSSSKPAALNILKRLIYYAASGFGSRNLCKASPHELQLCR
jgi:hypothetical protein